MLNWILFDHGPEVVERQLAHASATTAKRKKVTGVLRKRTRLDHRLHRWLLCHPHDMITGSEIRKTDYPIEKLLIDRWSPRAMSGEEISREELMRLFEAGRWAPSSFNTQQWRALMRAAARNTGRGSSICWLTRTKRGQKTRPFSSFLFRANFLITTTNLQ